MNEIYRQCLTRTVRRIALLALVLLGLTYTIARAEDISMVDQEYTNLARSYFYHIPVHSPIGQTFTPKLSALNVVEIWITGASSDYHNADVQVRIRKGTIDGPIIGTSSIGHVSDGYDGIVHLEFPTIIPVAPGEIYVIEALNVAGDELGVIVDEGPAKYARGYFIVRGAAELNKDMWFREGLNAASPTKAEECKKDGWRNLVRKDGTTFKNQGDCIQYVKKGQ